MVLLLLLLLDKLMHVLGEPGHRARQDLHFRARLAAICRGGKLGFRVYRVACRP